MLKVEKTEVFGWESAIRGMRNPLNSWDKSDTGWIYNPWDEETPKQYLDIDFDYAQVKVIGDNDLTLMKRLSKAGSDHAKFLRMINVTVDITAPLYWWKEFDTYKVGTVANSCSTMHKIQAKEFTRADFSCEKMSEGALTVLDSVISFMEQERLAFIETKDKAHWHNMIQLLPSSYNQKRTVQLNYQVLKQMYFARRNHKLDEWHTLCDWMENLPYFREICIQE